MIIADLATKDDLAAAVEDIRVDLAAAVKESKNDIATAVKDLRSELATAVKENKSDIAAAVKDLRSELAAAVRENKNDLAAAAKDAKSDLAAAVKELQASAIKLESDLRAEMKLLEQWMTIRLGGMSRPQWDHRHFAEIVVRSRECSVALIGSEIACDDDREWKFRKRFPVTLLEIKNLHVKVDDRDILKGLDLTVSPGEIHAIMGPNGSGKSTLAHVLAGKPGYEVTGGSVLFDGADLLALAADERAAKGVFLAFQYPLEIPGVATMTFLRTAMNAQRKTRGEPELSTPEFMKRVRAESAKLSIDADMLRRPVNVGFSGGEKKRNEILQMALLEPKLAVLDETELRARYRCPQAGRRRRQPAAFTRSRHAGDHPLPAASRPYRSGRRARAVERADRAHRRQGIGVRVGSQWLCGIPR